MKNWRELASQCREIPLEEVVVMLGGEKDPQDPQKWNTPSGPIWLGKGKDSHKFFDHLTGKGGGGAIDLAMHIQRCDFKQAVTALSGALGQTNTRCNSSRKKAAMVTGNVSDGHFIRPAADFRHLPKVVEYLTQTRGLSLSLVQQHVDRGQLYADARRNAVFICADGGNDTGAELRGTGKVAFKGMATGSRRGEGFFMSTHSSPTRVVIVESAIDALSYQTLFPGEPACIVSTAGVLPDCPALATLAGTLGVSDIAIAYDNDPAGNEAASKLIDQLAVDKALTLRRRTPSSAKDWNEALQQRDCPLFEGAE